MKKYKEKAEIDGVNGLTKRRNENVAAEIRARLYRKIHKDIYNYKVVKKVPSKWVEETIFLTKDVSRFSGFFKYDVSPYTKEVMDRLDPADPTRCVAIMKCAQSGFTQGVIIPGMLYIISENPDSMLFMAGDKELAKNSIRTRFDPVAESSGLTHLIRSNVLRKRNQRTGDTDFSKEYAGGNLIVEGTQNSDKMRQFSVKTCFCDDWEAAPRADKKEGSTRKLIEGRQTSFGNLAKSYYVSTPLVKQTSNIEPVYELGDQRKWNWLCPHCETYIPIEWKVEGVDGKRAGIIWKLNEKGRLVKKSVHYKCQHCGGKISESSKYDLNLAGRWIPTAVPQIDFYVSYQLNALVIPPGFVTWVTLVEEWMEANPVGDSIDVDKLKVFLNIRLGQTWEDSGTTPKVHYLMDNMRPYDPGLIPDELSKDDLNGEVVLLTLACDLNGIMNEDIEDVRLDWELVAHSAGGVTYSVDQGSLGSFKRARDKSKLEREMDYKRRKMTYRHDVEASVWPEFERLIKKKWSTESGKTMEIAITTIDVGFFTKLSTLFIESFRGSHYLVVGVKGNVEAKFRRDTRDTRSVRPSRESSELYIVEVNQYKDLLASFMKLRAGEDGTQPSDFMNFPRSVNGKYSFMGYFKHYEGERRVEEIQHSKVVGFSWEKKTSASQNHFWDVRIYNLAGKDIYIDLLRRSDPLLREMTWTDFAKMITS